MSESIRLYFENSYNTKKSFPLYANQQSNAEFEVKAKQVVQKYLQDDKKKIN